MAIDYTAPALPLTGEETVFVSQRDAATGRYRVRRVALNDVLAVLVGRQAATDARQDAALTAEAATRQSADAGLASRAAALEARPEEAAHFSATARLPALTVGQTVTLTLTGLVPAVVGDVLRKGEAVTLTPAGGLPGGVNIAAVWVPADTTVAVQLTTGLNLAAGSTPLVWAITAHR